MSIYFVIENSIKQPKNDFGRKNKLDNQFTLGPTTQPTLVHGLGFSWGHGNFGNNIRNMSRSIWDKIIKLMTTWNIHWEHIGNTNMNTIGNMWGNETRKLLSQLLSTPLEPLCMGHELPTMPKSSKNYLITLKMPKFHKKSFQIDMISWISWCNV